MSSGEPNKPNVDTNNRSPADKSNLLASITAGASLKKTKKNDETTSTTTNVIPVNKPNEEKTISSNTETPSTNSNTPVTQQTTSSVSTPTEVTPTEIEYFIQNASDSTKNEEYMQKLKEKGRCTDNNEVQACTFEHKTNNYKIKVTKTKSGNTVVDTVFELEKTGLSDEEIEKIHNALKDGKMSSFGVRKFIHEYTKRGNSEYRGYKKLIKGLQMLF